jgi:hypothetical protein
MAQHPEDRPGPLDPFEELQRDSVGFGGTAGATEPLWVLVSIVLGLIALSGSILALVLAVVAGICVWMARMPPVEGSQQNRYPFGGPITGPGIWP